MTWNRLLSVFLVVLAGFLLWELVLADGGQFLPGGDVRDSEQFHGISPADGLSGTSQDREVFPIPVQGSTPDIRRSILLIDRRTKKAITEGNVMILDREGGAPLPWAWESGLVTLISEVPASRCFLRAPGFSPKRVSFPDVDPERQNLDPLVVKLTPVDRVSFQVLDPLGQPAEGTTVNLRPIYGVDKEYRARLSDAAGLVEIDEFEYGSDGDQLFIRVASSWGTQVFRFPADRLFGPDPIPLRLSEPVSLWLKLDPEPSSLAHVEVRAPSGDLLLEEWTFANGQVLGPLQPQDLFVSARDRGRTGSMVIQEQAGREWRAALSLEEEALRGDSGDSGSGRGAFTARFLARLSLLDPDPEGVKGARLQVSVKDPETGHPFMGWHPVNGTAVIPDAGEVWWDSEESLPVRDPGGPILISAQFFLAGELVAEVPDIFANAGQDTIDLGLVTQESKTPMFVLVDPNLEASGHSLSIALVPTQQPFLCWEPGGGDQVPRVPITAGMTSELQRLPSIPYHVVLFSDGRPLATQFVPPSEAHSRDRPVVLGPELVCQVVIEAGQAARGRLLVQRTGPEGALGIRHALPGWAPKQRVALALPAGDYRIAQEESRRGFGHRESVIEWHTFLGGDSVRIPFPGRGGRAIQGRLSRLDDGPLAGCRLVLSVPRGLGFGGAVADLDSEGRFAAFQLRDQGYSASLSNSEGIRIPFRLEELSCGEVKENGTIRPSFE